MNRKHFSFYVKANVENTRARMYVCIYLLSFARFLILSYFGCSEKTGVIPLVLVLSTEHIICHTCAKTCCRTSPPIAPSAPLPHPAPLDLPSYGLDRNLISQVSFTVMTRSTFVYAVLTDSVDSTGRDLSVTPWKTERISYIIKTVPKLGICFMEN